MVWEELSQEQRVEVILRWGKDPHEERGTSEAPWLGTLYAFWNAAHMLRLPGEVWRVNRPIHKMYSEELANEYEDLVKYLKSNQKMQEKASGTLKTRLDTMIDTQKVRLSELATELKDRRVPGPWQIN